jgi:DNA-binding protein H-NS
MTKLDLEAMSLDELWELHECISATLSARMLAEKEELEHRLAQLHRGNKLPTLGVVETGMKSTTPDRQRRKYPRVFPKYQNPHDPSETWSGRGKQPRWLVAALKAGGEVEDFRIPPSEARLRVRG